MIQAAHSIVMPTIFLAQRMQHLHRTVRTELLCQKKDLRVRSQMRKQRTKPASDMISRTLLWVGSRDAFAKKSMDDFILRIISQQRVLRVFSEARVHVDDNDLLRGREP